MNKPKVIISDFDLTLVDITSIEKDFRSRNKEVRKQMEEVAKTLPLVDGWETVLQTLRAKKHTVFHSFQQPKELFRKNEQVEKYQRFSHHRKIRHKGNLSIHRS